MREPKRSYTLSPYVHYSNRLLGDASTSVEGSRGEEERGGGGLKGEGR